MTRLATRMGIGQMLCLVLVTLVMGASVWLGLYEGRNGLRDAQGSGQRAAAVFQILYGIAAIFGLIALFFRPGWARPAFGVWAGTLTATAALAPIVWGGAGWGTGVVSGVAAAIIAGLVCWCGFVHLRMKAE